MNGVLVDLGLAVLLVSFIMLLFLHSLRNSLIILVAIPASLISAFLAMGLFGYTLNLMTLLAMSLIIGILVDDSIVRGTTSKRIVTLLKEAGAKEVHVRISSPPLIYPSFYGIDISKSALDDAAQAIAHKMSEDRVLEEVILASQPVKKMVEPDEVAEMAAFLTGPFGGSITGVAISMDMGWTAR